MLDGNNEDRRGIDESYASAVSAGRSRVEVHRSSQADLIAAAGMNRHRMGMALMRLASEWNSGAVPPVRAQIPDAKVLAKQAAVQRVQRGIVAAEEEYGGLSVSSKRERRQAAPVMSHEAEFGQAEARRLAARSTDWSMQENMLRFQRLKTLGTVRAGLLFWVSEKGWEEGEHLVAAVLRHFLSPNCPTCNGSGKQVTPGTLGLEVIKRCPDCLRRSRDKSKRSFEWGKMNVPHAGRGKRLMDYLQVCVGTASGDLREGTYREHRRPESQYARWEQRVREDTEQKRRADAEAAADAKTDAAAVASRFESSMKKLRS